MKSYKGKEVNVGHILEKESKTLAVGNMRVNARGDVVGRGGRILKTKEQLENEYVQSLPNAAKEQSENPRGFNQGLGAFIETAASKALKDEPKEKETLIKTPDDDPNLSTNKNRRVKLSDISDTESMKTTKASAKKEDEKSSLDDLPLDEE